MSTAQLRKGELARLDESGDVVVNVVFASNPETITRRVEAAGVEAGGRPTPAGPPAEVVSLTLEIDATDALERADEAAAEAGILPALAALELLAQPARPSRAAAGNREHRPVPLTLFRWGRRTVPVTVIALTITEELFDPALNPLRALVEVTMRVLTYADFEPGTPGHRLCLEHLAERERLAGIEGE